MGIWFRREGALAEYPKAHIGRQNGKERAGSAGHRPLVPSGGHGARSQPSPNSPRDIVPPLINDRESLFPKLVTRNDRRRVTLDPRRATLFVKIHASEKAGYREGRDCPDTLPKARKESRPSVTTSGLSL
jgi:hypothetical protein